MRFVILLALPPLLCSCSSSRKEAEFQARKAASEQRMAAWQAEREAARLAQEKKFNDELAELERLRKAGLPPYNKDGSSITGGTGGGPIRSNEYYERQADDSAMRVRMMDAEMRLEQLELDAE